jgi:hypothetical protein
MAGYTILLRVAESRRQAKRAAETCRKVSNTGVRREVANFFSSPVRKAFPKTRGEKVPQFVKHFQKRVEKRSHGLVPRSFAYVLSCLSLKHQSVIVPSKVMEGASFDLCLSKLFFGDHRRRKNKQRNDLSHLEPLTTRGVSHCGLAIYIKKYFKAKEEL